MARQRLTDRSLSRKPPTTGQLELWDTVLPGFGLRISYGGRRTFFVMFRLDGRQVRRSVGTYPALSLAQARDQARDILRDAGKGIDVKEKQAEERRAAARTRRNTFGAVAEEFMVDHAKNLKPTTRDEYRRKLDVDILPHWGSHPIATITRADVKELLRHKARTSPVAANRVLALVRAIFNWALDEDIIDASPAVRIKPEPEKERERVLTDTDLRDVWRAASRLGYPFGQLTKMLILTGQRRGEVAGLRWDEIDGDDWRLPAARTKTGSGHVVHLAEKARAVLEECPRVDDMSHVLTSGARGDLPVSGWSKFKRHIDAAILEVRREDAIKAGDDQLKVEPIEDWTLHDIRRTVATGMRSLGIDRLVVSKVLNHAEGGITAVYDRYAADPEKRRALEVWAAKVESIVRQTPLPDNVLDMRRRAD